MSAFVCVDQRRRVYLYYGFYIYIYNDIQLTYFFKYKLCICWLPTPMTLAGGDSPIFPLVVHQPASPSIWLAVQSLRRDLSTNPGGDNVMRMWVQLNRWCVSCVWVLQRGHSGDGCDLASTLCKYDLRKGDLFVLSLARVRQLRRGSISSEMLMCGRGVRSVLLLPLVARCLETIDVCIRHRFVFLCLQLWYV